MPRNFSAPAPHVFIYYILTRLRRRCEDGVTPILTFLWKLQKKSHTDKLSPSFQGIQALKSRMVEALQLDPNEVSVGLLFHENTQRPCACNPDLKRPPGDEIYSSERHVARPNYNL